MHHSDRYLRYWSFRQKILGNAIFFRKKNDFPVKHLVKTITAGDFIAKIDGACLSATPGTELGQRLAPPRCLCISPSLGLKQLVGGSELCITAIFDFSGTEDIFMSKTMSVTELRLRVSWDGKKYFGVPSWGYDYPTTPRSTPSLRQKKIFLEHQLGLRLPHPSLFAHPDQKKIGGYRVGATTILPPHALRPPWDGKTFLGYGSGSRFSSTTQLLGHPIIVHFSP